ncbi:MAG: histidine--tRNA ligase [Zoogloeaceae bacterium]|jgi:histidyl-tRNA synthetase|nr:histidine--tRNA ligase [Zoogloeaceae bacterium]
MPEKSERKVKPLQSVRGMNDILPREAEFWEGLEQMIFAVFKGYGYRPIRLPIVESTPLFHRAIGEVTDIVEKEMFSFEDRLSGDPLTLRPEGTAGCARAVIEHGLAHQAAHRLYYAGPMFRHERPQKDRYRQFHQIGVETFGLSGPDIDAEHLMMLASLWEDMGLNESLDLQLNSLGEPEERRRHRADLIAYLEKHIDKLDADARRRLHANPLRILDSKHPDVREICADAPRLMDYLGAESLAHFEGLRNILEVARIRYEVNPRLVRGLDYYNRTVFEWVTGRLGAQGTVCAGGRYDGLVTQLGGKPTPACGFALGVERLMSLVRLDGLIVQELPLDVYVAHQGEAAFSWALQVAGNLRKEGMSTVLHCGGGGFRAQMKKADASGAQFSIIIGDDEAATRTMQVKALRDANFGQRQLALPEAVKCLYAHIFETDGKEL